jgi:hypothetical protein
VLDGVSELIGISTDDLIEALTLRTMKTAGEVFKVLSPQLAGDTRSMGQGDLQQASFVARPSMQQRHLRRGEPRTEGKTGFGFIGL